jgi:integrase
MAGERNRLSAKFVASVTRSGYYADGGNLYLQVTRGGSKSWLFIYKRRGTRKSPEMGLGSASDVSLKQAREEAAELRGLLRKGVDPLDTKRDKAIEAELARARSITFAQAAAQCIAAKRPDWRNPKHAAQWTNTIQTYAIPVIGNTSVQDVDTRLVIKVLEPIWTSKPETATRLRARIEKVLDWATASGHRNGENPARWRGHLDKLLPALKKKARVKHHPALAYEEVPAFVHDLRKQEGTAARALEFTILTAARTGEVIGARTEEFDLRKGIWTVPAHRMKAGKVHQVPLSQRAVEILRKQPSKGYVFPGLKQGRPLSNMAMSQLLKRMKKEQITVHGFRSSFRDWAAERTTYPNHVVEMALAHEIGSAVEAAYRRGDLLEKRTELMLDWAVYCDGLASGARVVKKTMLA